MNWKVKSTDAVDKVVKSTFDEKKFFAALKPFFGSYTQEQINGIGKDRMKKHARDLVNRLGWEMADVRDEDDTYTESKCGLYDTSESLLKKYMTLIIDCEGTDFLYKIGTMQCTLEWTDEERDALFEISELISNAH